MNYWIIPANPNIYKLADALNKMPYVDWRQHNNFQVGDIVFIYNSKPFSQIQYMMEVIAVNLITEESAEDREFWVNPLDFDTSANHNRFYRMKLLLENATEQLRLEDLLESGLKSAPQGAMKVREPLLGHILNVFNI